MKNDIFIRVGSSKRDGFCKGCGTEYMGSDLYYFQINKNNRTLIKKQRMRMCTLCIMERIEINLENMRKK